MHSTVEIVVGLFPGQGAYVPGALPRLRAHGADAVHALETIDTVAREMLGGGLDRAFSDDSAEKLRDEAPDVLQLAVFATSVAAFRALSHHGAQFSVLVGHSLGEIAALVAGGAFDVAEGTAILCHRLIALREHDSSGGGLLALGCAPDRAQQILDLLPTSGAVIAVDNGPTQTVIAGSADALRRSATIASAIGMPATGLLSPHGFHSPLLEQARQDLARRLSGYVRRGMSLPVYSPILGRYYRDSDDLGDLLASHLVSPVRFGPAVERLHRSGAAVWVEVGAGRGLTSRVHAMQAVASVHSPLLPDKDTIAETGQFLAPAAPPRTAWRSGETVASPGPSERDAVARDVSASPVASPDPTKHDATGRRDTVARDLSVASPDPTKHDATGRRDTVARDLSVASPDPTGHDATGGPDTVARDLSASPVPAPPLETIAEPTAEPAPTRETIAARVRDLFATTLEYPEEVFEDDAELEADLGVDSVKRVELMGRLGGLFGLGPPPDDLRMSDFSTFGQVVDFVVDAPAGAGTT